MEHNNKTSYSQVKQKKHLCLTNIFLGLTTSSYLRYTTIYFKRKDNINIISQFVHRDGDFFSGKVSRPRQNQR